MQLNNNNNNNNRRKYMSEWRKPTNEMTNLDTDKKKCDCVAFFNVAQFQQHCLLSRIIFNITTTN